MLLRSNDKQFGNSYQRFGGTRCLHLKMRPLLITYENIQKTKILFFIATITSNLSNTSNIVCRRSSFIGTK
jgi:hypothetical protein